MTIVAADIGGTFSRFTWSNQNGHDATLKNNKRYQNSDFSDFDELLDTFLDEADIPTHQISTLVLALPAPNNGKPVILTNIDWMISSQEIEKRHGIHNIHIINDFQAAAVGAIKESPNNYLTINQGITNNKGPAVVTGSGTGLGLAWFGNRQQKALPQATEGGHIDFAPNSPLECELYLAINKQYGHVSYERLLSGSGLENIYRFICSDDSSSKDAATILEQANSGVEEAIKSVELFTSIFAAYLGNLGLLFKPEGGIYLCGGITTRLSKWLDRDSFMHAFSNKGRLSYMVEQLPIHLALSDNLGLRGALYIAYDFNNHTKPYLHHQKNLRLSQKYASKGKHYEL